MCIRDSGEAWAPSPVTVTFGSYAVSYTHLDVYKRQGHDPVIWVSREAVFAPDAAIRGGIPLCCPWFGPGRAGDRPWIHGFVRTAPWLSLIHI